MFKYITLFVFFAALLSSCSKSSNPSGPGSGGFTQPKPGSSFTYDEYSIDTTTGYPVPGSRDTSVQNLAQTGIFFMGKTNVTQIISVSSRSIDTSYINFESNGDISVFVRDGFGFGNNTSPWYIIPTGSKSSISLTLEDTTTYILFSRVQEIVTLMTSFVDDETMTVKGQSLSVTKIKQTLTITTITDGVPSVQLQNLSFYFAPSLWYITRSESPVSIYQGTKSQGSESILIDYNEK